MMSAQCQFALAFNAIATSVEFQDSWSNGTSYFGGAVHNGPKLSVGEQVKSETANGRRLIITGTPVGNVVVFEWYSPVNKDQDTERSSVIVYNAPDYLRGILGNASLNESQVMFALGTPGNDNVGQAVKWTLEQAAKLPKLYDGW